MQAKDGKIHCTYSYKDEKTPGSTIKHVVFEESWIKGE
jgi:hypothetical protein